ncbi:MAG: S41 family peptidase [Alphaproteobacteria bacterium]
MRIFVPAAIVLMAFLFSAPIGAKEKDPTETYQQLHLLGEVFERVRMNYVDEVEDSALIEAAINGMLISLDPHSGYLNPKAFEDMQVRTKGEFGGLGIEVTMENGFVKVVSPIDDTPAHRAGLQTGDYITHLDDKPVLGLTLPQAVEMMRGEVGTKIKLTIRREGSDLIDVTITRARIKIQSVRYRLEDNVGYVRITSFNEQTQTVLKEAIKSFEKKKGKNLQGIVLDLRNNPGGLLDQAIAVSDTFLEKGEIVSTRGRSPEDAQRFNASTGDLVHGLPVVVLINGGSASASEIVAGALQDHHRAIVLGTRSFGKGSVQTIIPLGKYGAMRLTTARYYTPSGRSIQAKGIDPDILVEQARIEKLAINRTREEDLHGALTNEEKEAARLKAQEKKMNESNGEVEEAKDYQLLRALDLIRGVSLYSARLQRPSS